MEERASLSPLLEQGCSDALGEVELVRQVSGTYDGTGCADQVVTGHLMMPVNGSRELGTDLMPGDARVHAGKCYLVYCVTCLALTCILLLVTFWEAMAPRRETRLWRRKLRPWEESTEAFVGAALCFETLVPMFTVGTRALCMDRWRVLDAVVASLTLTCGVFFLFRRRHAGDFVEGIDVPMLGLRFALQHVRMVSTAKMVCRAHQLQGEMKQQAPEPPPMIDPRLPCGALKSSLTPEAASDIRELLPSYLRYKDWELAYSPQVHGTSLNTFYRQQAGPNVVVVRDSDGNIFGGFATQAWRPHGGNYGDSEAFVFAVHGAGCAGAAGSGERSPGGRSRGGSDPEAACTDGADAALARAPMLAAEAADQEPLVEVFWAMPNKGGIIQWSDSKTLGMGYALVVREDFLHGTSSRCETFGSPSPLSPNRTEFIIRAFECWHVGCRADA